MPKVQQRQYTGNVFPISKGVPAGNWGINSKHSGPNMYEQMGDHAQENPGMIKEAQPHPKDKRGTKNPDGANNGG